MKAHDIDETDRDDERFDRLADGELGDAERQELLASLDDQPGGWRRCAVAFLEAQAWGADFAAIAREPARAGNVALERNAPKRASSKRHRFSLGTLLAVAASFLITLVLGGMLQQIISGDPQPMVIQAADDPVGDQTPIVEDGPRDAGPVLAEAPLDAAPGSSDEKWWMVTLNSTEDGSAPIQVPVVERDCLDEGLLDRLPSPMPADVLEALERTGHEVRRSRQWLPLRMEDGRRLMVPVDQVEVHYVGGPTL